jgi:hypothetical protein
VPISEENFDTSGMKRSSWIESGRAIVEISTRATGPTVVGRPIVVVARIQKIVIEPITSGCVVPAGWVGGEAEGDIL